MNCHEFQSLGRDIARQQWLSPTEKTAAAQHAQTCTACRAWLEAERTLDTALRTLAPPAGPSPRVSAAVLSAFRTQRRTQRMRAYAIPLAAAAALLIGFFTWRPKPPTPRPVVGQQEFLPVPYGAPIRPMETLQVMRVNVPRESLVRMGVPLMPEAATGVVPADVLLGEDGMVKGIRFVNNR